MFLNAKYMLQWKEPKVEECWGIFITYNLVSTHSLTAPLLPWVSSLRGSRGYFTKTFRKAPGRVTDNLERLHRGCDLWTEDLLWGWVLLPPGYREALERPRPTWQHFTAKNTMAQWAQREAGGTAISVVVLSSPPGPSVHRLLQTSILEWVVIPFSRESSQPRDRTWVSCFAVRLFTVWTIGKPHGLSCWLVKNTGTESK